MKLVSVIIPSYNRLKYLQNTLNSIRQQTHSHLEIIVINDCSTDENYYQFDWTGIKIIHLIKNSREVCGHPCPGYVRNKGLEQATGDYIAFCDDDDLWFPQKLQLQLRDMEKDKVLMSCTDGLIGKGVYDPSKEYKVNMRGCNLPKIRKKLHQQGCFLLDGGFPPTFTKELLEHHNCCITSSVIVSKKLVQQVGKFKHLKHSEDYDYWLRCLEHTDCVFVPEICFYYDANHGDGQHYFML